MGVWAREKWGFLKIERDSVSWFILSLLSRKENLFRGETVCNFELNEFVSTSFSVLLLFFFIFY